MSYSHSKFLQQDFTNHTKTLAETANPDVSGPTSHTDNAIPRFDGTSSNVLKDSTVTIDTAGTITLASNQDVRLAGTATVSTPSVTTPLISSDNDLDLQTGDGVGIYITDGLTGQLTLTGSNYTGSETQMMQIDNTGIISVTTAGILPPRLTTAQQDALTPVAGTTIYNSDIGKLITYNGTDGLLIGMN